jgi:hypothetical protein
VAVSAPDEHAVSDEYAVYGDRGRAVPEPDRPGRTSCPYCGGRDVEEGFVEGTSDSLVRYYGAPREMGFLGVKRFGLERRPVVARRCLRCSRLDLFAPDVD